MVRVRGASPPSATLHPRVDDVCGAPLGNRDTEGEECDFRP